MMEYNPLYWQAELFLRWEEGQALADMLASFDALPQARELPGAPPPDVAAETMRRLTAVFYEQVDRVAHGLGAACCALYLVESAPSAGLPEMPLQRAGDDLRSAERAGG